MIPFLFIIGLILSSIMNKDGEISAEVSIILCVLWLVFGMITTTVRTVEHEYKQTAQFETTPIMVKLTDGGLDIVLDDYQHFHWVDYGLISKWKNGGKFYKTYFYEKEEFGPDNSKFELIIK